MEIHTEVFRDLHLTLKRLREKVIYVVLAICLFLFLKC